MQCEQISKQTQPEAAQAHNQQIRQVYVNRQTYFSSWIQAIDR